jgi:hypothetical protein
MRVGGSNPVTSTICSVRARVHRHQVWNKSWEERVGVKTISMYSYKTLSQKSTRTIHIFWKMQVGQH